MRSTTGNFHGAGVLERRLLALGKDIATVLGQAATRKAMKTVAEPALKAAAPVGPRPNGAQVGKRTHHKIKTSIKVKKGRSKLGGANGGAVVTIVTTGRSFHAIFTDRGTVSQPAQNWAEPAIASVAQKIIETVGTELGKGIDRHARRNP